MSTQIDFAQLGQQLAGLNTFETFHQAVDVCRQSLPRNAQALERLIKDATLHLLQDRSGFKIAFDAILFAAPGILAECLDDGRSPEDLVTVVGDWVESCFSEEAVQAYLSNTHLNSRQLARKLKGDARLFMLYRNALTDVYYYWQSDD